MEGTNTKKCNTLRNSGLNDCCGCSGCANRKAIIKLISQVDDLQQSPDRQKLTVKGKQLMH